MGENVPMYQCENLPIGDLDKLETRPTRFFFNLLGLFRDDKMYQCENVPIVDLDKIKLMVFMIFFSSHIKLINQPRLIDN